MQNIVREMKTRMVGLLGVRGYRSSFIANRRRSDQEKDGAVENQVRDWPSGGRRQT
jgi:hypothetical protein